jgi:hypothetical protein
MTSIPKLPEPSAPSYDRVSPSTFMRGLRPEYYSDTVDRTTYRLDAGRLEYHLESITSRNQHHDFEIFCRKLCQRTICPNLLPSTGPEGGGDSKADSETVPVADEISILSYIGMANSGREKWAFAFSAKKTWAEKVRKDVAGIVETERGYKKIFCVTAQFARAKDRSRIEDELTKKYGSAVTILDRSWIVEQVIAGDRKDLAFNYLHIGEEGAHTGRLGPIDYSRAQQLEDVERSLGDAGTFHGMEMQLATEALVAARLSRGLDRPQFETDGRFARAIRLADEYGTFRQKLDANYEHIWTRFWWFDDVDFLNKNYEIFETMVLESDQAKNLELLCNLIQLLFNSVHHDHLTAGAAKLFDRAKRLSDRLDVLKADLDRPNNALEAETSGLLLELNQALLTRQREAVTPLWPKFSNAIRRARGLGEFSAERLTQLIEVFGNVAGSDLGYAHLVDEVAAFVAERTGESQGALVLLKRAKQLTTDDHFEMIRLLGKAARQLTKQEHSDSLIDALQMLSIAYRSAGMLWAARASCIFALASIFIEAGDNSELPISVVPTIVLLGSIAFELRHLPEGLEAIRLARGIAAKLPLSESSKQRLRERLEHLDLVLASQTLCFTAAELQHASMLPDVLERLEMYQSRNALLYALGHEASLREEGYIPADETEHGVVEFFSLLAGQPVSDDLFGPVIFNQSQQQVYVSKVLGMRIEVQHSGSDASILAAEAVIGSIEALFSTTIDLKVGAHTEFFSVFIEETNAISEPDFTLIRDEMKATISWPLGHNPASYYKQLEVQKMLISLSISIFAATCGAPNMKEILEGFLHEGAIQDRIAMIVIVGNSHERLLSNSVSRLLDWEKFSSKKYTVEPSRPRIIRQTPPLGSQGNEAPEANNVAGSRVLPKDHRAFDVRSVIDVHLWDRAGWSGTAFADYGRQIPPMVALLFKDGDAARKIFERWRDRFGTIDRKDEIFIAIVRRFSVAKPAHYRVLITSGLPQDPGDSEGKRDTLMLATRTQTMEAESDANLAHFLRNYADASTFLLAPAIWTGKGQPEILTDLAILKRGLSVKMASQISDTDIEAMALKPRG